MSSLICLNSTGGCASTALFDAIAGCGFLCTPNNFTTSSPAARFKHTISPPRFPYISKAIFVYGDPVLSTLSIFRRNLAKGHLKNKGLCVIDNFNYDLESYLRGGRDWFCLETHIREWTAHESAYPILCIKSDWQWDFASLIFRDYLGASSIPSEFKRKPRSTSSDAFSAEVITRVASLLKPSVELYESLPPLMLLDAKKPG